MESLARRARERKSDPVDYDLTVACLRLWRLAKAMLEAATSPDPRVVHLGIELARFQGKTAR